MHPGPPGTKQQSSEHQCWQITLQGTQQGIGLRPRAVTLASANNITGWIQNITSGARIAAYGPPANLENFISRLQQWLNQSGASSDYSISKHPATTPIPNTFEISSSNREPAHPHDYSLFSVQADQAICNTCLAEFNDPNNRRYHYPFISCAQCGPRFSILRQAPFDRPHTSYADFPLCQDCETEYQDLTDRRFHAQTCSCPQCGPHLWIYDAQTKTTHHENALKLAASHLKKNGHLVLQTPTGFQLIASAHNTDAINTLRQLKRRPQKPFAVMFPNLASIKPYCTVSEAQARALQNPARAIVILNQREKPLDFTSNTPPIDLESLAPELHQLGCFLPTTGLHYLLLAEVATPLVVTSGNLGGDALYRTQTEALSRLTPHCRYFLLNNLQTQNAIDDSVIQFITDNPQILRRARGYVPNPITLNLRPPQPGTLGLGGGEKTSFALTGDSGIYLSQPFGNLDNPNNFTAYGQQARFAQSLLPTSDLKSISSTDTPIYYDLNSNYPTSFIAKQQPSPHKHTVQHHYSHFFAALNEHGLTQPTLGLIWDGAGLGLDNNIWGGECLLFTGERIERVGQLLAFPLLGGDRAARFPLNNALSLIFQCVRSGFLPSNYLTEDWWHNHGIQFTQAKFQ